MILKYFFVLAVLLAACGVLAGCGKKSTINSSVFNQAAPEIKEVWDQASAADKANDYYTAATGYHSLMTKKSQMTDSQIETLNSMSLALNQRLTAAVNSGDAAAKEASAKLAKIQMGH